MKIGARFIDLICFVIGPFIAIGSLLGFVYHFDIGLGLREKGSYYYPISFPAAKIGLYIGTALILLGALIKYRRKNAATYEEKKEGNLSP